MKVLKGKNLFSTALAFVMVAIFAFQATAQTQAPQQQGQQEEIKTDFTDEELENFVEVVKVQQENEIKMMEAIQNEGLDIDKFNEILQAKQNPEVSEESLSNEEVEKFEKASEEVIRIQQEMQAEVMQAINETGLGMETYGQIVNAYQVSPEVQQEIDKRLIEGK